MAVFVVFKLYIEQTGRKVPLGRLVGMVAFFWLARFGRRFNVHSMPVPFFLKSRSVCAPQFHVLGQDQSTVAEQAEVTVHKCFLMSLM